MGSREIWLSVVVPWQKRRKLNEDGFRAPAEESEAGNVKTLSFEPRPRVRSRR